MKYICNHCNTFVLDTEKGDDKAQIEAGKTPNDLPDDWRCPVCGMQKKYLEKIDDDRFYSKKKLYEMFLMKDDDRDEKSLQDHRDISRKMLAGICSVNKVCDGDPERMCMGQKYGKPIGLGGAGQGRTFYNNHRALARYRFRTRVIKEHKEPSLNTDFLGKEITMPVLVSSVSGVKISMNDAMDEKDFQRGMIEGAILAGTLGMSGNTVDRPEHPGVDVIKDNKGTGIPVFKPQSQDKLLKLFRRAEEAGAHAIGVDLDGYGSTNWALRGRPVYRKSEKDLLELVDSTDKPVIFKGIMSVEDASKAVDSGAKAIDVSNHGGRVIDYGQGVAEVLPDIAKIFKGKITIMADGAVRTGFDVLKLIALGADVALIGRPMARMSIAGGAQAVGQYLDYVKDDLRRAMLMTGCDTIKDINKDILVKD